VQVVQVREKESTLNDLLPWLDIVRQQTQESGALMIVNDQPHWVKPSSADGIHVGQTDASPTSLRAAMGPEYLIGLSTHRLSDIQSPRAAMVDYFGLGPIFDTKTKGLVGKGLGLLRECMPATQKPCFGIGGVTLNNLQEAMQAGLRRVAVCSAICAADDPFSVARAFREALSAAG
jgi:thiamine-phosphate diphosphorylase